LIISLAILQGKGVFKRIVIPADPGSSPGGIQEPFLDICFRRYEGVTEIVIKPKKPYCNGPPENAVCGRVGYTHHILFLQAKIQNQGQIKTVGNSAEITFLFDFIPQVPPPFIKLSITHILLPAEYVCYLDTPWQEQIRN